MVVWAVRSLDWTGTKDVTIVNGQIGLKPWHLTSLEACLWIVIHVVLGFKEEEVVEVACRPRSVSDFCVRCLEPLWVDGMDQGPQSSSTFPAFWPMLAKVNYIKGGMNLGPVDLAKV